MRTLFITQELVPFHSTGGMAVFSRDLPAALRDRGFPHTYFLPYIHGVTKLPGAGRMKTLAREEVRVAGETFQYEIFEALIPGEASKIVFVAEDTVFQGKIYSDLFRLHRNVIVGHAAIKYLSIFPGVYRLVHALDQLSALSLALIRFLASGRFRFLFNILSAEYDFSLGKELEETDFDGKAMLRERLGAALYHDSAIELGLKTADKAVTSSPAYSDFLTQKYHDALAMESCRGLLGGEPKLIGIEQGIDIDSWDPEKISRAYSPISLDTIDADKTRNRQKLLGILETLPPFVDALSPAPPLPENASRPSDVKLVSFIGRFCRAKGRAALYDIIHNLEDMPNVYLLFIVPNAALSDVDREKLRHLSESKERFWFVNVYDQGFAELAFAGADFVIMPSEQEPCGLCQKIAMRFGSLPIVTPVGGLKDTVRDGGEDLLSGNGFMSESVEPESFVTLFKTLMAMDLSDPLIGRMRRNAYTTDVSWAATIDKYVSVYEGLLNES